MPRLFASRPQLLRPIVAAIQQFQADAELVRIDQIDPRMPELDDWELLLALHRHGRAWDGLITTDSSMLRQARELGTLVQTKLTLVVAAQSGSQPGQGLRAAVRTPCLDLPADPFRRRAVLNASGDAPPSRGPVGPARPSRGPPQPSIQLVWEEHRLTPDELAHDPLAA